MLQKVCSPSFVKNTALALLFAGAAGCTTQSRNDVANMEYPQAEEVLSKEASDVLKMNFIADQGINDVNVYDSEGRLYKEYFYAENGLLDRVTMHSYTPEGLHREFTEYNDGAQYLRVSDSDDRIHQSVVYDTNGSVDMQYVYAYAADGTQQEIIYDGNGEVLGNYTYPASK